MTDPDTSKPCLQLAAQIEAALRNVSPAAFELIDACLAAVVARRAVARCKETKQDVERQVVNEYLKLHLDGAYVDTLIKRRVRADRELELAEGVASAAETMAKEGADALAMEIGL